MGAVVILGVFALLIFSTIVRGFVLATLWSWFIVPIGGPEISIPIAIGISCIVGMLTHEQPAREEKDIGELIIATLIGPFVLLGFAWIITLFM